MIKIDSGVPLTSRGRSAKWPIPWEAIKIGDSFVFPGTADQAHSVVQAARKKHKYGITVRKLSDGTVRVWRIS